MTHIHAAWGAAIESWTDHARAAGSPSTTVRTRHEHVSRLGRGIGTPSPWDVTGPQLLLWCSQQNWARETRRAHRTTYRAFWRWAIEHGHCDASPALALPPVKSAPPNPMPCPDHVYTAALAAADQRAKLMLRLAGELGMRRAEVAVVHQRDIVRDLIGWSLWVHGKGDKDRLVPLPDGLARAIATQLVAVGGGWLFPGDDRGHLSPRWVGKIVTELLADDWTMHKLRHMFATRANEAFPGDVFTLQEILGHASPVTTRLYTKVSDRRLREMVNGPRPGGLSLVPRESSA